MQHWRQAAPQVVVQSRQAALLVVVQLRQAVLLVAALWLLVAPLPEL